MSNWIAQHLRVLGSTLKLLRSTPVSSLLNILVIGIALSLPAGVYVLLQNVQNLADQVAGIPQISLFLSMNASKDDIARIGKQLQQHKAIDRIEFISREQALEQIKQSSGLSDVIGGLSQNPLPNAYIVYPKSSDPQLLETLRDELQKWPKLDKVQLDSAWAHKLDALLKFCRLSVLILTVLLSFALVAVTFNTIRLQILTQREEIQVSKLIGATDVFIRRPFLYFGLLQGVLGGVMAWLVISLSMALLNGSLAALSKLYASNFILHSLSVGDSFSLLAFSAFLGWIGAWLSVAQHLWQIGHIN
jgi:cell division transport system permease protein